MTNSNTNSTDSGVTTTSKKVRWILTNDSAFLFAVAVYFATYAYSVYAGTPTRIQQMVVAMVVLAGVAWSFGEGALKLAYQFISEVRGGGNGTPAPTPGDGGDGGGGTEDNTPSTPRSDTEENQSESGGNSTQKSTKNQSKSQSDQTSQSNSGDDGSNDQPGWRQG